MKKILSGIIVLLYSLFAQADIRLPSVLSDNMVLQQKSAVRLWGRANPGEKIIITASWNNNTYTVVATSDANWKLVVNTPVAGGPYTITFKGNNTIVLKNILIGEVWICSGQSNMEWSGNHNVQQIISELPKSSNPNIRLFNISKTTSATPQDNVEGEWQICGPESLKGFSAVGYFFGKKLQADLNVPVGLIGSNWGGTAAEIWTPAEEIEKDKELREAAAEQKPNDWWPDKPGRTYNAMIYPLINFSIAGVIWYQGESNTMTAATYSKLFTTMIGAWRKAWQKEFPFYYVQIAPFQYGNKNIAALLREQQGKALAYPNTGMVVITDLVDNLKDIHPQNKRDVGIRLANYALAETYQKHVVNCKSPALKHMQISKNNVLLFFDHAPNGFATKDGKMATEFFIAGEDKIFLPAEVKIEKDRIIVFNNKVIKPVAVRFAFSNTAVSNLFSKEGLPVCPFRTDDWEVDTGKEN